MGQFIDPSDLSIPDPVEAVRLIDDAEVEALRRVPALENVGKSRETVAAFRRIITRWKIEGPAAVVTQNAGIYAVGLGDRRSGWSLTDDEMQVLQSLVGAAVTTGGPRGSFPAGTIDSIFDSDRR